MLKESNLQELLDFRPGKPVLTIYLNTDPTLGNADHYKLNLRTLLKGLEMPADISAVEHYFEREFDWSGRSVAVFSCAAAGFFRAYSLAVPLASRIRISDGPHVKPLVHLMDFYGGYGVALVDKQGARMFYFHLGELIEQNGVLGEEVRHTKRGGASSMPGRRGGTAGQTNHADELVDHNMKDSAEFAGRFFTENNVRRIIIAGTDENVHQFRSRLPKSWQSLVVGTFPMSMTASTDDVKARAQELCLQAEYRHESQVVDNIVTSAAKKHGGVMHLDSTLKAVHDGRVHTLVIKEGYHAPGYQCQGCSYITAQALATCPFCGKSFTQIPDAVEMAVRAVMQHGGDVEVLQNPAASEKLGGIGALLRY
jgi:peptide subunit release factor 1 (eRF1)